MTNKYQGLTSTPLTQHFVISLLINRKEKLFYNVERGLCKYFIYQNQSFASMISRVVLSTDDFVHTINTGRFKHNKYILWKADNLRIIYIERTDECFFIYFNFVIVVVFERKKWIDFRRSFMSLELNRYVSRGGTNDWNVCPLYPSKPGNSISLGNKGEHCAPSSFGLLGNLLEPIISKREEQYTRGATHDGTIKIGGEFDNLISYFHNTKWIEPQSFLPNIVFR